MNLVYCISIKDVGFIQFNTFVYLRIMISAKNDFNLNAISSFHNLHFGMGVKQSYDCPQTSQRTANGHGGELWENLLGSK